MDKRIALKGFTTGILLQLAIGPVFFFILNIALRPGIWNGIFAVMGVTLVDYFYIILAIFGVGKFLENGKKKMIFSLCSSIVLMIFGAFLLRKGVLFNRYSPENILEDSLWGSFLSALILTISSPLTILFWTSIFTNKAIEYSLDKKGLLLFGLSAGMATLIFLGVNVFIFSMIGLWVPEIVFRILNIFVGIVLIGIGVIRIIKDSKKKGE